MVMITSVAMPASTVTALLVTAVILSGCRDDVDQSEPGRSGSVVADQIPRMPWGAPGAVASRSIGALQSPREEVFGRISAVAFGEAGTFIVDEQANNVRLFSPDSDYLATFGGPGNGPGELSSPIAVVPVDHGVIVGDRRGRVSIFAEGESGSEYEYVTRFTVPMAICDMCSLGDDIAISGIPIGGESVVHLYDLKGSKLQGMGGLHDDSDPIVQETMSWGFLACDEARGEVAYAAKHDNRIELYTDAGLKWSASLPGFRQVEREYREDPGVTIFRWMSPSGTDGNVNVFLTPGHVLVLTGRLDAESESPRDYRELSLYALDRSTGGVAAVVSDPPLIGALRESDLLILRHEPYPSVRRVSMHSVIDEFLAALK